MESERWDGEKKRLEECQARRAELLAEKLDKNQLTQQRRADHEAKIRDIADKIEAERNAINLLTAQQSEDQTEFAALYVREKVESMLEWVINEFSCSKLVVLLVWRPAKDCGNIRDSITQLLYFCFEW